MEWQDDGTDYRTIAEKTPDRPGVEHARPPSAYAHFHDSSFRIQKPDVVVERIAPE